MATEATSRLQGKGPSSLSVIAHGVEAWFAPLVFCSCLKISKLVSTQMAMRKQFHLSFDFWFVEQSHFSISLCNSSPAVVSWASLEDTGVVTRNQSQSCYRPCAQRPLSGVLVPLWNLTLLVSQGIPFWSHNPSVSLFHHSRTTVQSSF